MPVTSLAEPKVSKHNNKLMHTKTLSLSGIFFALCFSAGLETGVAASLPKPVSAESARGISPRAAHRTGRKPLDLSGSCHRMKAAAFFRDQSVPPVAG